MAEMKHEHDNRRITMAYIEEALTEHFGNTEYDRECGGYHGNYWFSIDTVLECIERYIDDNWWEGQEPYKDIYEF